MAHPPPPLSKHVPNAIFVVLAESSEAGAGTLGVADASTLTVAVVIDGAVQAIAEQEHEAGFMVTEMVEVDPLLPLQSSKVVVIVSVTVTEDVT